MVVLVSAAVTHPAEQKTVGDRCNTSLLQCSCVLCHFTLCTAATTAALNSTTTAAAGTSVSSASAAVCCAWLRPRMQYELCIVGSAPDSTVADCNVNSFVQVTVVVEMLWLRCCCACYCSVVIAQPPAFDLRSRAQRQHSESDTLT
jgi:hypothetical protein